MTSIGLVRIARAARRDGNQLEMVTKLANLGSEKYTTVFRDFRKDILDKGGIFKLLKPIGGRVFKHVILPSTVVKLLATSPQQFRLRLGAVPDLVQQFWTDLTRVMQPIEKSSFQVHSGL